jgi:hypothetical protein
VGLFASTDYFISLSGELFNDSSNKQGGMKGGRCQYLYIYN